MEEKCVWCGQPSQFGGRDFLCFGCYWDAMERMDDEKERRLQE